MLWQKKVRGGVLLYALLMAAIFSLLLQFYLHRQVANHQIFQSSTERREALAMAQLSQKKLEQDKGIVTFDKGKVTYQRKDRVLKMMVETTSGSTYQYEETLIEPAEKKSQDSQKASSQKATKQTEKE